jgi:hypothetical protein
MTPRTETGYDSYWLISYFQALAWLREFAPAKVDDFRAMTDVFRVPAAFREVRVDNLLPQATLAEFRDVVAGLQESELETHEFLAFGRWVVHDHPIFTAAQDALCSRISEIVGEPLQRSYNFLALYNNLGVCDIHRDAPVAKWTVDICLEQSAPWPLHVGPVGPWVDPLDETVDQGSIRSNPNFSAYSLAPGETLVFGGSAQWHYRQRIPRSQPQNFCNLLFLHYIPEGSAAVADPANWPDLLAEEALSSVLAPVD